MEKLLAPARSSGTLSIESGPWTLAKSKRNSDDLLIGDDEWITFVTHDWAKETWLYIDDLLEPLEPLFSQLEVYCVAECCGLDAFSFTRKDIDLAASKFEANALVDALNQAVRKIDLLDSDVLGSKRLNNGIDRGTMIDLLRHIRDTIACRVADRNLGSETIG
jgi:hypothetical protein